MRDGKRYFPGDQFPDANDEQIQRLVKAGCLRFDPEAEAAAAKAKAEEEAKAKAEAEAAAAKAKAK
ncbi:hypothetical protein [Sphingosinithalassobacter portus]|uniref:hypothetical protein n=1 Tax=Stakelama portus TaxID=2676234 RepID=UPI0018774F48|nr:hypothetical protein [Sphingosinithalassobacter portus]